MERDKELEIIRTEKDWPYRNPLATGDCSERWRDAGEKESRLKSSGSRGGVTGGRGQE